ncbi:MAG: DNA double-strand break repair nuclease NurA [Candidatus Latescibacterota bacterium]
MLDLAALKKQINRMTSERENRRVDFSERVGRAFEEWGRWRGDWKCLADKVTRSRTSWLVASILEPIGTSCSPPERPEQLTVVASDGSPVHPDRHEISSCYLVNVGRIAFHYGTLEKPTMASRPRLFYQEEDLYPIWGGRKRSANSEIVSTRMAAMELEALADLAGEAAGAGRITVALSDGTLILWALEGKPPDFREAALENSLALFERFRNLGIPLAGYISQPGSRDVVNALQVGLCPLDAADCERCPYLSGEDGISPSASPATGHGEDVAALPCEAIEGVTDRLLFDRILGDGERSGLFGSSSKILADYGVHRTQFFYVNVGHEVARVEIPTWVAKDPKMLGLVHTCVVDQAAKGNGYPIALAEAHEQAVVQGPDRELFYRLLEGSFVQHGIRAQVSRKGLRKRTMGV